MRLISRFFLLISRLLSIVGFASVLVAFLLYDFMFRSDVYETSADLPRTAIVFTGAYDRIDLGLDLLSSGTVDRLLITGANRTSGLIDVRFPELFDPNSEQAGWIKTEKIVLAPDAHSTLENALETACWLDTQPEVEAVALITSQRHMARASVALQHGIAPISVLRVVSDPASEHNKFEIDLIEFGKFIATWAVTLLPRTLWPANELNICLDVE